MMNMGDSNNGGNIVSRVVFKTISNVYDGAIFQNKLTIKNSLSYFRFIVFKNRTAAREDIELLLAKCVIGKTSFFKVDFDLSTSCR